MAGEPLRTADRPRIGFIGLYRYPTNRILEEMERFGESVARLWWKTKIPDDRLPPVGKDTERRPKPTEAGVRRLGYLTDASAEIALGPQ